MVTTAPAPLQLNSGKVPPPAVLYADAALVLVVKPAGLLSVPGRDPELPHLAGLLEDTHGPLRIVHRLDMATSGVMVLARDAETHRILSRQFEQRRVRKRYEALVAGVPATSQGSIDLPLICDWPNRPRQKICHSQGKPALTLYEVVAQQTDSARLALTPVTGRSHQLRIHLAALGHPILGCEFYAPQDVQRRASRLQLHATDLWLTHPHSGAELHGHSPAPF